MSAVKKHRTPPPEPQPPDGADRLRLLVEELHASVAAWEKLPQLRRAQDEGKRYRRALEDIRRVRRSLEQVSPLAGTPGLDPRAFEPSAKARAIAQGRRIAEQDLRTAGGTYDLAQVEALLAISRQAIERKVRQGTLLAVPGPGNRRRYPVVQFTAAGLLPGLKEAFAALGSANPWYRLNWLVNPDPRLGDRTPAELLAAGDVATAVAAARAQGVQGG